MLNRARNGDQLRLIQVKKGYQTQIIELQNYIFFGTAHTLIERVRQRLNAPNDGRFFQPDSTFVHEFPDLDRGIEWCEEQLLLDIQKISVLQRFSDGST